MLLNSWRTERLIESPEEHRAMDLLNGRMQANQCEKKLRIKEYVGWKCNASDMRTGDTQKVTPLIRVLETLKWWHLWYAYWRQSNCNASAMHIGDTKFLVFFLSPFGQIPVFELKLVHEMFLPIVYNTLYICLSPNHWTLSDSMVINLRILKLVTAEGIVNWEEKFWRRMCKIREMVESLGQPGVVERTLLIRLQCKRRGMKKISFHW